MSEKSIKYKLLATDVDGTLTDENRELDIDVLKFIREIRKYLLVVITTGNNLYTAELLASLIGVSKDYIIAENGGVLKLKGRIIVLGDKRKALKAYEYLKARVKNVEEVKMSSQRLTDVALKRTIDVRILREYLKNFDIKIYDTKFAIHLLDKNVDKARALEKLINHLNIKPDEVIAVGDSENDRNMLRLAGYSICIGDEIKDVADICFSERWKAFKHILEILR